MGWKSNKHTFFKINFPFPSFLPFILMYVKKVLNLQNIIAIIFHMFSIFNIILFVCYNLLADLVPYIINLTISNFLKKLV